jgi:hypothetical protein
LPELLVLLTFDIALLFKFDFSQKAPPPPRMPDHPGIFIFRNINARKIRIKHYAMKAYGGVDV